MTGPGRGSSAASNGGARQDRWTRARPPRGDQVRGGASRTAVDGDPLGIETGDGLPARPVDEAPQGVLAKVVAPTGVWWAAAGLALLVTTAVAVQLGAEGLGVVSVPLAGVLLAVAASRRIARRRPDEAWVGRWLVLGVVAKLIASYLRYSHLGRGLRGRGRRHRLRPDSGGSLAAGWLGDGHGARCCPTCRRTNFVRWFTGVVYYLFGSNMVAGFFVFGLLALVGSYLWYRATVDAVPSLDKRLYLALVLFAPSIAFWPASIGKEALMQLGIGVGGARHRRTCCDSGWLAGLLVGVAGGWLLWVVRPHLLALVTVAAACAYFVGRVSPARVRAPALVC